MHSASRPEKIKDYLTLLQMIKQILYTGDNDRILILEFYFYRVFFTDKLKIDDTYQSDFPSFLSENGSCFKMLCSTPTDYIRFYVSGHPVRI